MRLFVAVDPGPVVREKISNATAPLRQAREGPVRWVKPESLHLTLKFLGSVSDDSLASLIDTLDDVSSGCRATELGVDGFAVFPSRRRPKVLWAACEPAPPLELLQHQLAVRLASLGFESESKPFRPHITVGRSRRNADYNQLAAIVSRIESLEIAVTGYIDSVELMASSLAPGGAVYRCVHTSVLQAE